jgi:phosphoglycolate phosphatase
VSPFSKPSAFIFDWDNTLVDSWSAIAEAINDVRAAFGETAWTMDEVRAKCVHSAREIFPQWYGADWQKAYDLYYRRFGELRQSKKLQSLRGAESLLQWLKDRNLPAMVVSNRYGPHLRHEVAALKWNHFFVAVIGAQDAARDKPARDPVDLALGKTSIVANADVWFVGDSEVDVTCARNAGCTPVLLGSSTIAARLSVAQNFSDCEKLRTVLNEDFAL